MDQDALTLALSRLFAVMSEKGLQKPITIGNGLQRQYIIEQLRQHKKLLSEEIIGFYELCSRSDTRRFVTGYPQLFDDYFVLDFKEAMRQYEQLLANDEEHNPAWFPFLYSDSGDFYHIDGEAAEAKMPCIVRRLLEFESAVAFQDITAMINTITDCYKDGAFLVEDGNFMDIDYTMEAIIALRNNPGVAFWQESK